MGKHIHGQLEPWITERTGGVNNRHANGPNWRTFPGSQPSVLPEVPQSDWLTGLVDFEGGIDPGGWWRDARTGEMGEESRDLWCQTG